jgi:hypothetical protein
MARALNRASGRTGKVFADRYHARPLRTPAEVANAVRYVLENFRHHLREDVAPLRIDPRSSGLWLASDPRSPIVLPRSWLLRQIGAKSKSERAGESLRAAARFRRPLRRAPP